MPRPPDLTARNYSERFRTSDDRWTAVDRLLLDKRAQALRVDLGRRGR